MSPEMELHNNIDNDEQMTDGVLLINETFPVAPTAEVAECDRANMERSMIENKFTISSCNLRRGGGDGAVGMGDDEEEGAGAVDGVASTACDGCGCVCCCESCEGAVFKDDDDESDAVEVGKLEEEEEEDDEECS